MTIDDPQIAPVSDAAAFRRLQQDNQLQIIGKLLHDLRNPVHSMRITVELFNRIVQAGPDAGALLMRAARYVGPAEAALAALSRQTERFATYLGPPLEPALQAIDVEECLHEIALLVRGSKRAYEAVIECAAASGAAVLADRPRLSHALLSAALRAQGPTIKLRAEATTAGVRIACEGETLSADADVRTLIERAGGVFIAERPDAPVFARACLAMEQSDA